LQAASSNGSRSGDSQAADKDGRRRSGGMSAP